MTPTSGPDWAGVRSRFAAASRFAYLDLARKALLPDTVRRATDEWLADVDETGGRRAFSMAEIEAARADVARVWGAPADRLAFVKNTSEGINVVAQGLDWRPGDNVVISSEEHENNTFPWRPLAVTPLELDRLTVADVASILWSEFLWVWVPAMLVAVAAQRLRRAGVYG